ncbi:MAG: redoxin family protein [Chloroflexota bacterium]|nr:redoxin family protein [Chloroflexota bacterium]MDE2884034.1 redoxin family protein [Chloroflexota bacterium]
MTGLSSIVRVSVCVLALALLAVLVGCSGEEATPTDEPAAIPVATATDTPAESVAQPAEPAGDARPTPMMPEFTATGSTGGGLGDTAPEFTGISEWLNSEPLMMAELRGDVVLIDFWTYTCVNCIRTMPYLRDWNEKYADRGLTMIGVHTPEFDFEKITENVVAANDELGVVWPVAQDNDFGTWRSYNNRFWPAKYLIDAEGVVRYTHFGEGAYDETEHHIRALLEEAGNDVSDIAASADTGPTFDQRARGTSVETQQTREIYGGWDRNSFQPYIAHLEYYEAGPLVTQFYLDPGEHFNHALFLHGSWHTDFEAISHGRETEDYEDYIALRFFARTVNIVLDLEEGVEPFEVEVTIAESLPPGAEPGAELAYRPLTPDEAGEHIVIEDGRSYFVVDEPDLYNVVSLPEFGDAELKFSSNSAHFALFALTFGSYDEVF